MASAPEEELDVGLPAKGLNQIVKDCIPDIRVANESRELLHQCCVEFIRHLSQQAQRISVGDQRKTITHEHVLKALEQMSFPPDYMEVANSVLGECREQADRRLQRKNSRLDKCGIPEEELYRQQQELIERAREQQAQAEATQLAELQQRLADQRATAPEAPTASSCVHDLDEDYDTE